MSASSNAAAIASASTGKLDGSVEMRCVGAIEASSAPAFLIGTAIAGSGFGLSFLGSFRTLSALASPGERANLVAAVFIEAYTAFSIPVVIAGVGATRFGLHRTALDYSAALGALAALALINLFLQGRTLPAGLNPLCLCDRNPLSRFDWSIPACP